MKRMLFLLIFLPLMAKGAFEAIDCEKGSIFENPARVLEAGLQTLWVESFGILPYARVSYSIGQFGVGVSNFGNELYRENEVLLGYGWRDKEMGLGVLIRAMGVWIKEHDSDFTMGLDFGANFHITPSFGFNLALQNINFPKISGEDVPKRVVGELVARPVPDFTTRLQLYKESWYPIELRIRNEIELSELFGLGIGMKTYPSAFSFGVLLNYKELGLSYFVRTHENLGLTHIIEVRTGGAG